MERFGCGATTAVVLAVVLAACGGSAPAAERFELPGAAPCPVAPIRAVVSTEQWAEPVRVLGGRCVGVRVLVHGATGDPHEFEPSPSDLAAIERARFVLTNGLGYDTWATGALDGAAGGAGHLDAGSLAGHRLGDNPHLWFDPVAVRAVAGAVTAALGTLLGPGASSYLADRAAAWEHLAAPVGDRLTALRPSTTGRSYLATEPVYASTLAALGMVDATPGGYADAAANEADPAPADLAAAVRVLRARQVTVVVVNRQTLGAAPSQLRRVAQAAGLPVVEVGETLPPGAHGSLVAWQLAQLDALAAAIGAP